MFVKIADFDKALSAIQRLADIVTEQQQHIIRLEQSLERTADKAAYAYNRAMPIGSGGGPFLF